MLLSCYPKGRFLILTGLRPKRTIPSHRCKEEDWKACCCFWGSYTKRRCFGHVSAWRSKGKPFQLCIWRCCSIVSMHGIRRERCQTGFQDIFCLLPFLVFTFSWDLRNTSKPYQTTAGASGVIQPHFESNSTKMTFLEKKHFTVFNYQYKQSWLLELCIRLIEYTARFMAIGSAV